jgi:hypothetical protein
MHRPLLNGGWLVVKSSAENRSVRFRLALVIGAITLSASALARTPVTAALLAARTCTQNYHRKGPRKRYGSFLKGCAEENDAAGLEASCSAFALPQPGALAKAERFHVQATAHDGVYSLPQLNHVEMLL